MIFFSDFEKAFDSINHDYLFKSLKHFNFSEDFIKWIKLFYSNARSCVTNNGFLSRFFPIQRGVRQGCPLSPYLFILCIELLTNQIRYNKNISGINICGLFSFLSSLPISVLRNLELEANKLYDRANKLYKAALLTRCYVQHFISPYIDSEVNHKRHFIKIPFI